MKRTTVAAVVVALALAGPAFAGMYMSAKTTGEGRSAQAMSAVVKSWADGKQAKVTFESSNNPMAKKGMYMLTKDGGTTVFMVNPEDKNYFKWDMEQMMGLAGAATKMVSMKFNNVKVELLSETPGEMLLGMPTVHYKYRTSYDMSMAIMMMKKQAKVEKIEDIWVAPKLVDLALGFYFKPKTPKTGNEEMDNLVKAEMSKAKGFPLKHVTVTTNTDSSGKVDTSSTTMEVTELQMTPVPASTFEIPADYKEVSMAPEGGESGEANNPLLQMLGGKKKPKND